MKYLKVVLALALIILISLGSLPTWKVQADNSIIQQFWLGPGKTLLAGTYIINKGYEISGSVTIPIGGVVALNLTDSSNSYTICSFGNIPAGTTNFYYTPKETTTVSIVLTGLPYFGSTPTGNLSYKIDIATKPIGTSSGTIEWPPQPTIVTPQQQPNQQTTTTQQPQTQNTRGNWLLWLLIIGIPGTIVYQKIRQRRIIRCANCGTIMTSSQFSRTGGCIRCGTDLFTETGKYPK